MFTIILIMATGIGLGWLLRGRKMPFLGRITNALIWVLLFLLGVEVGGDERIVNGIASLGLEAILISVAGVAIHAYLHADYGDGREAERR